MNRFIVPTTQTPRASAGLLVLRLIFGLAFVLHGLSKAPAPFTWAAKSVPGMPAWLQLLVVVAEGLGGVFLMLGALTTLGATMIALDMVGAFFASTLPHGGSTFVDEHAGAVTYEKNLVYFAVAVALLLTGPGRYAIDALVARRRTDR